MIILLLLSSLSVWAKAPTHWAHILEVKDRHEFYQNHQNIDAPKDAWQTLFSLVYVDSDLKRLKDCVYFRVPGKDPGVLKITTTSVMEPCEDQILNPGNLEVAGIKGLQFAVYDREVSIDLNLSDFKTQKWEAELQGNFVKPKPQMSMSSVELKSPKIIYLAPKSSVSVKADQVRFLKDKTLCHDVNEDCQEVKPSSCDQCESGWYEVPNGCEIGPKYCGTLNCGGKDAPACRRGMKWQRSEQQFDCRTNSSFAYCSKGLKVTCEGQKAFCR